MIAEGKPKKNVQKKVNAEFLMISRDFREFFTKKLLKRKNATKENCEKNQGFSTSTEDGLMSVSILASVLTSLAPSLASL